MNIIAAILFGIYGVIGGVSTVVCTVSIPGIIIAIFNGFLRVTVKVLNSYK